MVEIKINEPKKETSEVKLEFVMILDKSGSMYDLRDDVIGGANAALAEARKNPLAKITVVFFDNEITRFQEHADPSTAQDITPADYIPSGTTALLDAMGETIASIEKHQSSLPDAEKADKILVNIMTDGEENASVEYTRARVKSMIEDKEKSGIWEFVFMGANIDAVSEASSLGIRADRAATYHADSSGTKAAMSVMAKSVATVNAQAELDDADLFSEIDKDNSGR